LGFFSALSETGLTRLLTDSESAQLESTKTNFFSADAESILEFERNTRHDVKIVNGRRSVTPSTALRLAKFFNMSADFWMNLQLRWDMYYAQQVEIAILKKIEPLCTR
jgi:addiction module HigA family antidote